MCNNESYRDVVQHLSIWCDSTGTQNTENQIDYRGLQAVTHTLLSSSTELLQNTSSLKFLGIHTSNDRTWSLKSSALAKKAQQCLSFYRALRNLPFVLGHWWTSTTVPLRAYLWTELLCIIPEGSENCPGDYQYSSYHPFRRFVTSNAWAGQVTSSRMTPTQTMHFSYSFHLAGVTEASTPPSKDIQKLGETLTGRVLADPKPQQHQETSFWESTACVLGGLQDHSFKNSFEVVAPSCMRLIGQGFILQQDDSKHKFKPCQNYLNKKEQNGKREKTWPAQFIDLNPIELVWDELDRRLKAQQPPSATHLWELLQQTWKELYEEYLLSIVERTPQVCSAVKSAKGGYFDELKV